MAATALLSQCIDYAGLFPPASLDVQKTIENYSSYRAGPRAWALGRLILPAGRFVEFAETDPTHAAELPMAVLLSADFEAELHRATNCGVAIEVVECKALPLDQITAVRDRLPLSTTIYFEVPVDSNPQASIAAIADAGGRAKIRTGGITPGAIPSVSDVARFLSCCVQYRVPFKATAGLHHPIRAVNTLTYAADSDRAMMHGFVNVILATAVLANGEDFSEASALLEDTCPENFALEGEQARWRDWSFRAKQIADVREKFMVSFGSCSFTEPLDEMNAVGWLP